MSDFDGVGAGDVMTLEECVAVIDDLTARLAAAEADAERRADALDQATEYLSHVGLHTNDRHALHFAQMAQSWIDAARGGE